MEQGAVKRSGRGRPRIRPLRLVGDKGYRVIASVITYAVVVFV